MIEFVSNWNKRSNDLSNNGMSLANGRLKKFVALNYNRIEWEINFSLMTKLYFVKCLKFLRGTQLICNIII